MKRQLFAFVLVAVVVSGVTAYAHHSFTSTYFDDKTVKIEGKILQFQFRNPHSFVTIEAPDEKGEIQRWGVEWGGATQLGGQGVTRYTLKAGDVVVITGRPGRTLSDHRILMRTLLRKSDGFGWGAKDGEVVD
ncbi:MAG TPA: DUF6152 family protein [Terriglobia bacterium]|nr:DUF6152 family protein [Terriglobia bacterium]